MKTQSFTLQIIEVGDLSVCRIMDTSGFVHKNETLNNSATYLITFPGGTILEIERNYLAMAPWAMFPRKIGSELMSINEVVQHGGVPRMQTMAHLVSTIVDIENVKITEYDGDDTSEDPEDLVDEDAIGADFLLSAILVKGLAFIGSHPNAQVEVKITNCGQIPDCTMSLSSSRLRAVEVHEDPEVS